MGHDDYLENLAIRAGMIVADFAGSYFTAGMQSDMARQLVAKLRG